MKKEGCWLKSTIDWLPAAAGESAVRDDSDSPIGKPKSFRLRLRHVTRAMSLVIGGPAG